MGVARSKHLSGAVGTAAAAGVAYVAGSYLAARKLSQVLLSPAGLKTGVDQHAELLADLKSSGAQAEEFWHPGDSRNPAVLRATFASLGAAGQRATLLFLHGKGGNGSEWRSDAVRAIRAGYNVLCPDLRGHGGSGGEFITYGILEARDMELCLDAARERFGIDPNRVGIHACSAGCLIALKMSERSRKPSGMWLESPFSDPRAMARHYLHLKSGWPTWLLALTAHWAVAKADSQLRRKLRLSAGEGFAAESPLKAAERVRCPVELVFGKRDELVLPDFVPALIAALPRNTSVWEVENAGHCHHEDEAAAVARPEYERRWLDFFGRCLGR
jgi:hypothetical protein